MRDKIDHKIHTNFVKGKYSYNDYLAVKHWFNGIEENKEMKDELYKQWEELIEEEKGRDESLQHVFEKIHYNILLEEKKRIKKSSIWKFYRQAAAILLVPVLAFSLWFYLLPKFNQQTSVPPTDYGRVEINAPDGARVEFFLPDGSSGWLNSGASLKYPVVFTRHRKVELSGEAWFNVKHLDQSDFIVSVPDIDIKVMGTKFNISAYPGDPFTDVVLEEGSVEVNGKAGVFNHTLLPDEKITFNRVLKTCNLKKVDAKRHSAWKDGFLIIDNEPLGNVVSRLERWYNVEIFVKDETLKKYRFKATFKDESLEDVLKFIAISTPIKYSIEKRTLNASGILNQKKVIIKLK